MPIAVWHYLGASVRGTVLGMETTPNPTTIEPASPSGRSPVATASPAIHGDAPDQRPTALAPEALVVDVTTRPRPERLSPPGPETRRTVVDGVTFVHQRFRGATPSGPPSALLQHFPAETGAWDPMAPPRTSDGREVILMEHWDAGAEADTDEAELDRLARECLEFIDALGLAEADLLGFSLGVRPPDDVVLLSPRLVERLVSTSHHARRPSHDQRTEGVGHDRPPPPPSSRPGSDGRTHRPGHHHHVEHPTAQRRSTR
jgi:hypothetical protein